MNGHRVKLTFGRYGCRVELIHPEGDIGCPMEEGECVLTDWVEECGDELLRGEIEFPVKLTWSDGATPELNVCSDQAVQGEEGK